MARYNDLDGAREATLDARGPLAIDLTIGQAMMWAVLAENTASTGPVGHGVCATSSVSGGRTFGRPASASQQRMPAWLAGRSEVCQVIPGSAAPMWTACWPVPLPISSTVPGAVR